MKPGDKYYLRTDLTHPVYIFATPDNRREVIITDKKVTSRRQYLQSTVLRSLLLTPEQRDKALQKERYNKARRERWKQEIYDDGFTVSKNDARDGELDSETDAQDWEEIDYED